jgi:cytochrome P450
MEAHLFSEYFTEWQMMAAISDIWSAGLETTVATLQFAVIFLLNHPEVQQKLHEEIDSVIGREQELTMDDQKRLPYLCATIQEVQRLANIIPINFQHTVTEDVSVAGYLIRKGTEVVGQTSSVHLDEKIFPDPDKFEPKRHLDGDGNFVKSDHVMPFSLGMRACMGESLAQMELFLFLGTLMQQCEFQSVDAEFPPKIAVSAAFLRGILPFECVVVARR